MSDIRSQLKNLIVIAKSILKTMDDESESDFDSLVLKIKRITWKAPHKKIGRTVLLRKLKIKANEMDKAINVMIRMSEIEFKMVSSNTKTKRVYLLIGKNYK